MMLWLWNALILLATVILMEIVAALSHKYIMHGWGWGWHLSHHEPHESKFELNDLYAVVFALLSIGLIWLGVNGVWPLQWIGAGMTTYGALYFMVHDGLVHQRWPFRYIPQRLSEAVVYGAPHASCGAGTGGLRFLWLSLLPAAAQAAGDAAPAPWASCQRGRCHRPAGRAWG
jgi:hypothetical protein